MQSWSSRLRQMPLPKQFLRRNKKRCKCAVSSVSFRRNTPRIAILSRPPKRLSQKRKSRKNHPRMYPKRCLRQKHRSNLRFWSCTAFPPIPARSLQKRLLRTSCARPLRLRQLTRMRYFLKRLKLLPQSRSWTMLSRTRSGFRISKENRNRRMSV